jgi:hypothetical protein
MRATRAYRKRPSKLLVVMDYRAFTRHNTTRFYFRDNGTVDPQYDEVEIAIYWRPTARCAAHSMEVFLTKSLWLREYLLARQKYRMFKYACLRLIRVF